MAGHIQVRIAVKTRWWVSHYIAAVTLAARLTGLEPDMGKARRVLERGVVIKVVADGKAQDTARPRCIAA